MAFNLVTLDGASFDSTPFYSIPASDIILKDVEINKNQSENSFEKKSSKKFILNLTKEYSDIYDKLPEQGKKIVVKLASLNALSKSYRTKKVPEPYSLLYKKNRAFNLETLAIIPMDYKTALAVVRNYASYNDWALKNINIRRNGDKAKYFVDINELIYDAKNKLFDTRVKMNRIISGNYKLDLLILDSLDDESNPNFTLKMKAPSKLAKDVQGTFHFLVPKGADYFVIYFAGKTEVNWAIYNFLPIPIIRTEVLERVDTLLENIRYKVENSKKSK